MTNSGLIQIHQRARGIGARSAAPPPAACCDACSLPLLAPTLLYAWLWIALLTFRELTLAVILTTATTSPFRW